MVQFYKNKSGAQLEYVKGHKISFEYTVSTRSTLEYSLRIVIDDVNPVLDDNGEVLEIYTFPYTFHYKGRQINVSVI